MKNNSAEFWDRQAELDALRSWRAHDARLAVIHGRRRLGKTALVRRWLAGDDGWYVQATEGTPSAQRAALAEDLQAAVPGLADVTYPSWRALLEALRRGWPARAPVLVLDEFPYLAQAAPELASTVQAMIDRPGRSLPLVLCGSSQRMMQGLVLDAAAPLFGRAQLILRVEPLPCAEIQQALRLPDAVTAVEAYASFGGVPRYWDLWREGGCARASDAVSRLVLSPRGVLHDEADRALRDEDAATLERAICELIGRGARRPSEIAARLGVKETVLSKPLKHLTELGLVERQAPYDLRDGRPEQGGRRSFYRLADPFLAMWYSCVRPHLSGLNVEARTSRERAMTAWTHHVAATWESLCRQQWHRLGHGGIDWEPAGRYWEGRDPDRGEWDVVSVSGDRRHVFLGEAKWMHDSARGRVEEALRLIELRPAPPVPPGAMLHRGLFVPARRGLRSEVRGIAVLDADAVMGGAQG
ncbi:MAG TPA: ATP-binding protein [Polyangia bacterium]|jgi:hypothetical protein